MLFHMQCNSTWLEREAELGLPFIRTTLWPPLKLSDKLISTVGHTLDTSPCLITFVALEMEGRLQHKAEIAFSVWNFPDSAKSQLCPLS